MKGHITHLLLLSLHFLLFFLIQLSTDPGEREGEERETDRERERGGGGGGGGGRERNYDMKACKSDG